MMASFHLSVPPTLGTICLVWNCGQVGERGLVAFQAITHALRPAGNLGRRIKDELGIRRALPLSYLGIWSRRPDSNRRPRAYQAITQSCDPSKWSNIGQGTASDAGVEPAASGLRGRHSTS